MNKLILFDIDGTLITSGGAGTRAMNIAFKEVFDIEDAFDTIKMAGKTDIQIMKEGLQIHSLPYNHGNLENIKKRYISCLRKEIENPMKGLKPGIKEALLLFEKMKIPLGLLTGNLREGAEIKLNACGIYHYFIDGAFGSDDEDRNKLLPVALRKFTSRGWEFSPQDCVVIGDTPRDVACAKIYGAISIAVATGPYSKELLINTDADIVLDSLEEKEKYMHLIRSIN